MNYQYQQLGHMHHYYYIQQVPLFAKIYIQKLKHTITFNLTDYIVNI